MRRMSEKELDNTAERLQEIQVEEEVLRATLLEQVEAFGYTPPRADKSKRLDGSVYEFTVTRGFITEIKDTAVQRIRESCPRALFDQLFQTVTKFKLAEGAHRVMADRLPNFAPRHLRMWFNRAVVTTETGPRLRIEKIECSTLTPANS